ncbi:MAG: cyclin-dependent kinase inhibitor 3 family protein [Rubrobacter sp.]
MGDDPRTSKDYPLRVDWVDEVIDLPAGLGMTFAPGMKADSSYGFRWERDLQADLAMLRGEYKADYLVSLMEDFEYGGYGMDDFFRSARESSLRVMHFSIVDTSVPEGWEENRFVGLILDIKEALEEEKNVVIHCRGGLGRTGTVAACVLVSLSLGPEEAIQTIRETREGTIEFPAQEEYVRKFARRRKWNR